MIETIFASPLAGMDRRVAALKVTIGIAGPLRGQPAAGIAAGMSLARAQDQSAVTVNTSVDKSLRIIYLAMLPNVAVLTFPG